MAFFLLIYVVFVMIWLVWAAILIYHAYKFRFPHDESKFYILAFLIASGVILFFSIIFISGADWTVVPKIMGGK